MGMSSALGMPVGALPAGSVIPYAGTTSPAGWLLCYGQAVSRTEYGALFTAIGTTYGSGDGSTTFTLPDLRGRVIAGVDNMGGSAASRLTSTTITGGADAAGEVGGAQTHTLTSAESGVPAHSHANTLTNNAVTSGNQSADHTHSGSTGFMSANATHSHTTKINTSNINTRTAGTAGYNVDTGGADPTSTADINHTHSFTTGGVSANHTHSVTSNVTISNVNNTAANASSAHNNVQPTMVMNYIIKAVAF